MKKNTTKTISIIGLGYVGLPLAIEFSRKFNVIGFDKNQKRIIELKKNIDVTSEVSKKELRKTSINFTYYEEDLLNTDVFIITVPTPVDKLKNPDLRNLASASKLVGSLLKKNNLVIYESTVYPGATEEFCIPILEKESGLSINKEFYCGYSPERVNPGDNKHKITDILKLTSGSNPKALRLVNNLYKKIIKAGTYQAKSIKIAEAAKIIENTQRDLNIALVNELSIIFNKMNLDTKSIIDAASTKWNFNKFSPGLVGGHCIGVDPYYLTYKAKKMGYSPEIILSGRSLNDNMHKFVAREIISLMKSKDIDCKNSHILILGATFKENCPDVRNSKVFDLINFLDKKVNTVECFDPLISDKDMASFNINWLKKIRKTKKYDVLVLAVPHKEFLGKELEIMKLKKTSGIIYDLKSCLPINKSDGRL